MREAPDICLTSSRTRARSVHTNRQVMAVIPMITTHQPAAGMPGCSAIRTAAYMTAAKATWAAAAPRAEKEPTKSPTQT